MAEKIREGAVDDALLRSLISNRQYTEFVIAFTWLTGVSMAAAQIIIKDRTFEPLAIACRDARISRQTFARIVFSLRRGEEAKQKALRILDLYPKAPAEAAERIMRFWRMRSPEGRSAAFASYTDNETDADKARS